MLNERQMELLPKPMIERIDELNLFVLRRIGKRLKRIGELRASDLHQIKQIGALGADLDDIKLAIAKTTDKNIDEIDKIFDTAKKDHYEFTEFDKSYLSDYIAATAAATKKEYVNISKTTGFVTADGKFESIARTYQSVVDKAITAVSTGVRDYHSAIRDAVKQLAKSGLHTVEYTSGATRRMDAAVKMNVLDGVKETYQRTREEDKNRPKYDGVEISVHANSAPDHEDIQGHQFTNEQFERMNNGLPFKDVNGKRYAAIRRPCAMNIWNCSHIAFGIFVGEESTYSQKELNAIKAKNGKGFTYEGKHYTGYEAKQMQNKLYGEMKKLRDASVIAEESGDTDLLNEVQAKARGFSKHYRLFSKAANVFYEEPLTNYEEKSILSYGDDQSNDEYETKITEVYDYDVKNIAQELRKAETEIRMSNVENAYVYSSDGKAYRLTGSKYAVDVEKIGANALKGATVTHNHPHDERGPSKEDFYAAAKNQIKELRTVDRTKTYTLKFDGVTLEEIEANINDAKMNMYERRMNGEDGEDQAMIAEELAKLVKGITYGID